MSPGLGYFPSEAEPNHIFPNQIVDNAPRGIGQQVAAQIEALEMSTAAPARRTHNDVLRSNTGWFTDAVSWAKRRVASQTLEQQTAHLAGALGRAGISVTREGDVTLISGVTGIIEQQPVYRAVRILPTVAGRDRRPILNDAKFWMGNHPNRKYFRFAVMTCPEPVPVGGDLRGAIQGLSRRITRWASAVGEFGVHVLYRGIEFTRDTAAERGMEDRYDPDTILYHVHANVVYWPTRKMKDEEFQRFLKFTRESVGAWWRDNGKVERLEEVIKYCCKPADTLAAGDDELVWLYHATSKLKLCQPLGLFKEWRAELEKAGEKTVCVNVGRGQGKLLRVKKMHRNQTDDKQADGEATEGEEGTSDDVPEEKPKREDRPEDSAPATNIVLGMTLPQWRHSPWAEPLIIVQHYDPLKLSDEAGGDIREWQRQAREWWDESFAPEPEEALRVARMAMDAAMSSDDIREAAEAAPYIVHTCSSTVRTGQAEHIEADYDDLEDDERDIPDGLAEVVAMFPGGRRVDYIPFESPEREKREAELRESLARKEAWWAECRVSAAACEVERARQAARWAEWCARSAATCRAAA
ncbi:hypothetical protein [Rhizobium cremeum]|uniref:hypothetical protein n=1 Tax=Rhizobium cremeum TaxID=2813827 RepID=UPI0039E09673